MNIEEVKKANLQPSTHENRAEETAHANRGALEGYVSLLPMDATHDILADDEIQ